MILYHATFGAYLDSIMEKGLIPRFNVVWEDCEEGVFLANDEDEAYSYPETTDNPNIPDEYIDDIIVFAVDTDDLDPTLLGRDPHVIWNENPQELSTWIYRGIIPPSCLKLVRE